MGNTDYYEKVWWGESKMSMVLSLQGCMAVGKTTALQYIQRHVPYVNVSFESNRHIVELVKARNLDKNVFEDYIEIQKLWIQNEITRWENAQKYDCTIMDFGAEEIEFYTFAYPQTIGANWDVEAGLHEELVKLRKCLPDRILYLDASEETLRKHKENDTKSTRKSFDYYIKNMLPLKRKWFIEKDNVDVMNIDGMDRKILGERVKIWVDTCIAIKVAQTREYSKDIGS